jgi:hypothetical protein
MQTTLNAKPVLLLKPDGKYEFVNAVVPAYSPEDRRERSPKEVAEKFMVWCEEAVACNADLVAVPWGWLQDAARAIGDSK